MADKIRKVIKLEIKTLTYVCTRFMTKNGWSLLRANIFVNGAWVGATEPSNIDLEVQIREFLKGRAFTLQGKPVTDDYLFRQFENANAAYDGIDIWVGRKKDL